MSKRERGISIDIGTDFIKMLSYKKRKNRFKVLSTCIMPMPDCEINDGVVGDLDALAKAISTAMKKNKIRGKNVNFILNSNKIITREVNYPDLPRKKLAPLIEMNAGEYFPVNLSDYTMDFEVLGHYDNDGENMLRANIVVIPTEIVNSFVKLASKLKLKLKNISYGENAMMDYSLLIDDDRPYMLIDLASEKTSLAIVNNNSIALNRTVGKGVKHILDLIIERYDVDYQRAFEISGEESFIKDFSQTDDSFSIKLTSHINLIVNGVASLLDYYSSKNNAPIEKIYLSGAGANIKGLDNYIENYFSIDTSVEDNIKIIRSRKKSNYIERRNIYANSIGAAYSSINLIPSSIAEGKRAKLESRLIAELAILLIISGAYIGYSAIEENKKLEKQKFALEEELSGYVVVQPVLDELSVMKQKNKFIEEINFRYRNKQNIIDILEAMEKKATSDLNYAIMGISKDVIIISCEAVDKNTVVNFLMNIKKLKIGEELVFSDVFIESVQSVDDEDGLSESYDFTITCAFAKEVENEQK